MDRMSEFKISCPHCAQHMLATEAYEGVQINCPACKNLFVVRKPPAAPMPVAATPVSQNPSAAPAVTLPSPARPPANRTTSVSTSRKRPGALKTVLVAAAALIAIAVLGVGAWFGYSQFKPQQMSAPPANENPAAKAPVPNAQATGAALDILTKVHEAYAHLASFSAKGTRIIDLKAATVTDVPKTVTDRTEIVIKLARPDLYLIAGASWTGAGRTAQTNLNAIWSTGPTNFSLMWLNGGATKNLMTIPDRKTALMLSAQSGGLTLAVADLFFDEGNDMARFITDWEQTEDDRLNGQDCFTLNAKMLGQKLKVWVSKTSFLLLQSKITLGAPVSDADIEAALALNSNSKLTPQQAASLRAQAKQQAAQMTKVRGIITETCNDIETDKPVNAADFNYPLPGDVPMIPDAKSPDAATTAPAEKP